MNFSGTPVTTDIPMLRDQTIYEFYIIRKEDRCNLAEMKAAAKLCNVNDIKAKTMLVHPRVLIAEVMYIQ